RGPCWYTFILECRSKTQHNGQAATVVLDAGTAEDFPLAPHSDIGALGKHRVEVSGDHHSRQTGIAGPFADHVADTVNPDLLQPRRHHPAPEFLGAKLLF